MRLLAEWAMVCGFADYFGWSCSLRLPRIPQSSFRRKIFQRHTENRNCRPCKPT